MDTLFAYIGVRMHETWNKQTNDRWSHMGPTPHHAGPTQWGLHLVWVHAASAAWGACTGVAAMSSFPQAYTTRFSSLRRKEAASSSFSHNIQQLSPHSSAPCVTTLYLVPKAALGAPPSLPWPINRLRGVRIGTHHPTQGWELPFKGEASPW
jgi:hypothetical protein